MYEGSASVRDGNAAAPVIVRTHATHNNDNEDDDGVTSRARGAERSAVTAAVVQLPQQRAPHVHHSNVNTATAYVAPPPQQQQRGEAVDASLAQHDVSDAYHRHEQPQQQMTLSHPTAARNAHATYNDHDQRHRGHDAQQQHHRHHRHHRMRGTSSSSSSTSRGSSVADMQVTATAAAAAAVTMHHPRGTARRRHSHSTTIASPAATAAAAAAAAGRAATAMQRSHTRNNSSSRRLHHHHHHRYRRHSNGNNNAITVHRRAGEGARHAATPSSSLTPLSPLPPYEQQQQQRQQLQQLQLREELLEQPPPLARPRVMLAAPPLLLQCAIYDRKAWLQPFFVWPRLTVHRTTNSSNNNTTRERASPATRRGADAHGTRHHQHTTTTTTMTTPPLHATQQYTPLVVSSRAHERIRRPDYRASMHALIARTRLQHANMARARATAAAAATTASTQHITDDTSSSSPAAASSAAMQLLLYGGNEHDTAADAYACEVQPPAPPAPCSATTSLSPAALRARSRRQQTHSHRDGHTCCTSLLDTLWAAVDVWCCVRCNIASQTRLLFAEEQHTWRAPRRFLCESLYGRDGNVARAVCTMCLLDMLTLGAPCGCCYHGLGTTLYGWRLRYLLRSRYRVASLGVCDLRAACCCPALAVEQQAYEMSKHGLLVCTTRNARGEEHDSDVTTSASTRRSSQHHSNSNSSSSSSARRDGTVTPPAPLQHMS